MSDLKTYFKDGYQVDDQEVFYVDGTVRRDPLRPFRFAVTVRTGDSSNPEILFAGITKVTGLKWKVGVARYFDGGGIQPRAIPTRPEYEPIVLTRGIFASDEVWYWAKRVFNLRGGVGDPSFRVKEMRVYQLPYYDNTKDGVPERMGDGVFYPERAWNLYNLWPSEYDMGELDRESDGISLGQITVEHEGCIPNEDLLTKTSFKYSNARFALKDTSRA
jgi:phage tail-like protein